MYRTNQPVTARGFWDRDHELERLRRATGQLVRGNPTWIAILGRRKTGKTSLLLELAHRERGGAVRFAIMDTQEISPTSSEFFRLYALRALDALLLEEAGASLEALGHDSTGFAVRLTRCASYATLDAQLQRDLLDLPMRDVDLDFVKLCIGMPERLARALDTHLIIAIDEFQDLAQLAGRAGFNPFALMRSAWQRHQRVGYVISGSAQTMLAGMITSEDSPFFQHFDMLDLGPLPADVAVQLLIQEAPDPEAISPELAAAAVALLGHHPFYVQLFGDTLTQEPGPYNEASVKSAMQRLLFSKTGRLALFFEGEFNRLVGRSTYLAATLNALAVASLRQAELARQIKAGPADVRRYLERLGDAVVRLDDGRFALLDQTFGLWLRWRQPGGATVPMRLLGDEAERTTAEHLVRLGFDLVYTSRQSRGAFDLLATRGGLQLGIQVRRSAAEPLRFKKTEWARMVAAARGLGWQWAVSHVSPEGEVRILDPDGARKGREIRLGSDAAIENVLLWLGEKAEQASSR